MSSRPGPRSARPSSPAGLRAPTPRQRAAKASAAKTTPNRDAAIAQIWDARVAVGIACSHCGVASHRRRPPSSDRIRCSSCGRDIRHYAGTVLAGSKLPPDALLRLIGVLASTYAGVGLQATNGLSEQQATALLRGNEAAVRTAYGAIRVALARDSVRSGSAAWMVAGPPRRRLVFAPTGTGGLQVRLAEPDEPLPRATPLPSVPPGARAVALALDAYLDGVHGTNLSASTARSFAGMWCWFFNRRHLSTALLGRELRRAILTPGPQGRAARRPTRARRGP